MADLSKFWKSLGPPGKFFYKNPYIWNFWQSFKISKNFWEKFGKFCQNFGKNPGPGKIRVRRKLEKFFFQKRGGGAEVKNRGFCIGFMTILQPRFSDPWKLSKENLIIPNNFKIEVVKFSPPLYKNPDFWPPHLRPFLKKKFFTFCPKFFRKLPNFDKFWRKFCCKFFLKKFLIFRVCNVFYTEIFCKIWAIFWSNFGEKSGKFRENPGNFGKIREICILMFRMGLAQKMGEISGKSGKFREKFFMKKKKCFYKN